MVYVGLGARAVSEAAGNTARPVSIFAGVAGGKTAERDAFRGRPIFRHLASRNWTVLAESDHIRTWWKCCLDLTDIRSYSPARVISTRAITSPCRNRVRCCVMITYLTSPESSS